MFFGRTVKCNWPPRRVAEVSFLVYRTQSKETRMPRRKQPSKIALKKLSDEQRAELARIEEDAILHYEGTIDELEKALGMLRLGHHVGWKVLVLVHSKRTIAKYEEILGIKLRDVFEAEGPSSQRSLAFKLAAQFSNFWKVVSGETQVPDRQKFSRN
jgi:hypothetical protein